MALNQAQEDTEATLKSTHKANKLTLFYSKVLITFLTPTICPCLFYCDIVDQWAFTSSI